MFIHNAFYGHSDLLRDYCRVVDARPVPGILQHGWTPSFPFSQESYATPWPKLIWSRRVLDIARKDGIPRCVPIAAPFLYLPTFDLPAEQKAATSRRLIAFPMHGWEAESIDRIKGSYERYAASLETLAKRDGFSSITISLYWLEHDNEDLRRIFQARGFSIATNGHRDSNPRFLHKARDTILQHGYATTNRIGTAIFYAMALGLPGFLYGPPMGLSGSTDPTGEEHQKWEAKHFPELAYAGFQGDPNRDLAHRELGGEFKLPPEILKEILGWSDTSALAYWQRKISASIWHRSPALHVKIGQASSAIDKFFRASMHNKNTI